jgi:murein DD-endopeptidase MepM/ murein hydrolase activator NlpD
MYAVPVDAPVSSSWQDHKDRNPPSSEPGTDYACGYGTAVGDADPGTVIDLKSSNSGGTGRYVTVGLDSGSTVRYLHLSEIWVSVGQRVGRGTAIGASGASGYGSDWYYGPHVHTTLWPGDAWVTDTVDFELYAGDPDPEPTPEPEPPKPIEDEDDMPKNSGFSYTNSDGEILCFITNAGSGFFTEWYDGGGAYNSAVAAAYDTPSFAAITEAHRDAIYASCSDARAGKASK